MQPNRLDCEFTNPPVRQLRTVLDCTPLLDCVLYVLISSAHNNKTNKHTYTIHHSYTNSYNAIKSSNPVQQSSSQSSLVKSQRM